MSNHGKIWLRKDNTAKGPRNDRQADRRDGRFMEEDVSEIYGDRLADVRRKQIGFIISGFYLMDRFVR